jgi:hypothetical protein
MANSRIGGIIQFKVDGETYLAKGAFTYNLGEPKREMVVGSDGVHGFKEMPKVAFIEGSITDTDELDLSALQQLRDTTVTLNLANGKVISLESAVYTADGDVTTEEGEVQVRFEGLAGREISG